MQNLSSGSIPTTAVANRGYWTQRGPVITARAVSSERIDVQPNQSKQIYSNPPHVRATILSNKYPQMSNSRVPDIAGRSNLMGNKESFVTGAKLRLSRASDFQPAALQCVQRRPFGVVQTVAAGVPQSSSGRSTIGLNATTKSFGAPLKSQEKRSIRSSDGRTYLPSRLSCPVVRSQKQSLTTREASKIYPMATRPNQIHQAAYKQHPVTMNPQNPINSEIVNERDPEKLLSNFLREVGLK